MRWRVFVPAGVVLTCACQAEGPVSVLWTNHLPHAEFTAPAYAPEGSPLSFDATASFDPDGEQLSFSWDFGDGTTLTTGTRSVEHAYRNNGEYTATLTVRDPHDGADTVMTTMTIANVDPQITKIDVPDTVFVRVPFEIDVQYREPGLDDTVRVTLMSWSGSVGEQWTAVGPGPFPAVSYRAGSFRLDVIVQDDEGATNQARAEFIVVPAPGNQ